MGIINVEEDREFFFVGDGVTDTFPINFTFQVADEIGVDIFGVPQGGLTVVGAGIEGPAVRTVQLSSPPVLDAPVRVYDATQAVRRGAFSAPGVTSIAAVDIEFDRVFQYLQALLATSVTSNNILDVLDSLLGTGWRDSVPLAEAARDAAIAAQGAAETAETNAAASAAAAAVSAGDAAQAVIDAQAIRDSLREELEGINVVTSSRDLVIGDDRRLLQVNSASPVVLTIPPNADVAFPLYTRVHFLRYGAGSVTLAEGTGVTLRTDLTTELYLQYSIGTILKIGTDEWTLFGGLVAP